MKRAFRGTRAAVISEPVGEKHVDQLDLGTILALAVVDGGRDALRVLTVSTIGSATFDPGPDERPVPGPELRRSVDRGFRRLLAGTTATSPG
jgi:hypothetical protein